MAQQSTAKQRGTARTSGLISSGWSSTKVGCCRELSTSPSNTSFSTWPTGGGERGETRRLWEGEGWACGARGQPAGVRDQLRGLRMAHLLLHVKGGQPHPREPWPPLPARHACRGAGAAPPAPPRAPPADTRVGRSGAGLRHADGAAMEATTPGLRCSGKLPLQAACSCSSKLLRRGRPGGGRHQVPAPMQPAPHLHVSSKLLEVDARLVLHQLVHRLARKRRLKVERLPLVRQLQPAAHRLRRRTGGEGKGGEGKRGGTRHAACKQGAIRGRGTPGRKCREGAVRRPHPASVPQNQGAACVLPLQHSSPVRRCG